MEKKSKTLVTCVQVQPGLHTALIPSSVYKGATLTVVSMRSTVTNGKHGDPIEVEIAAEFTPPNGRATKVVHNIVTRPFAECQVGERLMVETAIGWLDGIVQA